MQKNKISTLTNFAIFVIILITHFNRIYCEFPTLFESLLSNREPVSGTCAPSSSNCNADWKFYTTNGACNNLEEDTTAGQAKTPYARILPASYSDGLFQDRIAIDGQPLPLARLVRTTVLPTDSPLAKDINNLFEGLGQFVSHDTTRTPPNTSNPQLQCCVNGAPVDPMPEECRPVIIPPNDPFYSQFGITCIQHTRLVSTRTLNCQATPVMLMNDQTAFMDLSLVYSADDQIAQDIRASDGGLLKVKKDSETNDQEYPTVTSGAQHCPLGGLTPQPGGQCLFAGDSRINQNIEMLVFDVMFVRLHNYICTGLKAIHSDWNNEDLYLHGRRIVTAMYQYVVSNEYIPLLIGTDLTNYFKLTPAEGHIEGYNSKLNPQTFHEYASAAGRISHSTNRGVLPYSGSNGEEEQYRIREKLFNHGFIFGKNIFLNLITALSTQACEAQDQFFSEELTDHLFEAPNTGFGSDLASVDLMREREFGLAGYNFYRQICGLDMFDTIDDMASEITRPEDVNALKTLYTNVDDIDLYVGLALEKPIPGSTLGPTGSCIIGWQFYHYKFADRLWYEFESAKFTPEQLQTIRTTTLAEIICISNPEIQQVRTRSLLIESDNNPLISCDDVPKIDLNLWIDEPQVDSGTR